MRTVLATRYVTPLREGGSLPAIVEGDDCGLHVAKFRGAGQGPKALVAEVISAALARALGLRVPDTVRLELDAALGRNEPDAEIRELLKRSAGPNLGVDYLPGAVGYDPAVGRPPAAAEASLVVILDAFLANIDRTPRNPNLLVWHGDLWLIDHGAALWFAHAWERAEAQVASPFAPVKDHVLLPWAADLPAAAERLRAAIGPGELAAAAAEVPDEWLEGEPRFASPAEHRAAYVDHLARRLAAAPTFLEEAERARAGLV
jgi:hypothetical protein